MELAIENDDYERMRKWRNLQLKRAKPMYQYAITLGKLETIKLFEHMFGIEYIRSSNILSLACSNSHEEIALHFLNTGVIPTVFDLHNAYNHCSIMIVDKIIKQTDWNNVEFLSCILRKNDTRMIKHIGKKMPPWMLEKTCSRIDDITTEQKLEMIQTLLDSGLSVNENYDYLKIALEQSNWDVVEFLLKKGANPFKWKLTEKGKSKLLEIIARTTVESKYVKIEKTYEY